MNVFPYNEIYSGFSGLLQAEKSAYQKFAFDKKSEFDVLNVFIRFGNLQLNHIHFVVKSFNRVVYLYLFR